MCEQLFRWAWMDSNQRPRSYQGFGRKPTEFRPFQIQNARCAASFFGIRLRSTSCSRGGLQDANHLAYDVDVISKCVPICACSFVSYKPFLESGVESNFSRQQPLGCYQNELTSVFQFSSQTVYEEKCPSRVVRLKFVAFNSNQLAKEWIDFGDPATML